MQCIEHIHFTGLVNCMACIHTRNSFLSQKGTLWVMPSCEQALFPCLSLTCLELFVAMLSSVHFCIFFYAQVSVFPSYLGLRDNETMIGIGLLCIFHSHCPPKQILLLKILGVVCILILLLCLWTHMSLLICHSFYHNWHTTWETKVPDSTWENRFCSLVKIMSSLAWSIGWRILHVPRSGLLIKPQDWKLCQKDMNVYKLTLQARKLV